jgi:hypothetical protein
MELLIFIFLTALVIGSWIKIQNERDDYDAF